VLIRVFLGAFLCSALTCVPPAGAAPISYGIKYEVQYFGQGSQIPIDARVQLGDVYYGSISFDDAILGAAGINLPGSISAFTTSFEDVTWTLGQPYPLSQFAGFRGPNGLGSASPGLDVLNGELVNLRGGIFGTGDVPFIDFSSDLRIPYVQDPTCSGAYCGNISSSFWSLSSLGGFGGSMQVYAVPEPPTAPIVLVGLALLGIFFRFRKQRH
jgi:hypothetical protein